MTTKHIPTWRQVFDTNHKMWWTLSKAFDGAIAAGYPYMAWNGNVYDVLEHVQKQQLKIVCTVDEMDK